MSRSLVVRLYPETIFRWTLWIIAGLVAASLFASFMLIVMDHGRLWGLADLVDLDHEKNLPTLFSSVQLLFAGSLAWYLGAREPVTSSRWLWRFLGAGLCFMALDETASIHELGLQLDIGSLRDISYFRFAWVVPGFAVVAVCGAVLLKLLLALPRHAAAMFILSGGIFLAGSLGMEMLGAHYYKPGLETDWAFTICYTLEETLEMLGPALFIRTALRYAIAQQDEAAQRMDATPESAPR